MNFYKHYLGDFQRDTGHLGLTERGAYLALMHHYYATEMPLPNDHAALCRIAGAFTKPEREAVKSVTAFFELRDAVLWHKRIEAELEKQAGRCDKNRVIALAREERKRVERESRDKHANSTKRAHVVPRDEHQKCTIPEPEPEPKPEEYFSRNQHTSLYAKAMMAEGLDFVSSSHPDLISVVEAGATPAQCGMAAQIAIKKSKGFPYAIGVLRQQMRDATHGGTDGAWDENRSSIEKEGQRLGLGAWDEAGWSVGKGIDFKAYQGRVSAARAAEKLGDE